MTTLHHFATRLTLAALLALPMVSAQALSKPDYKAAKKAIASTYKADKAACASLSANAKDICVEEAKAKEKVAYAELEFNYTGKPADQTKLQMTKAKTAYAVAKERCDDKSGNDKDVCVKQAKAVEAAAIADAKMIKAVNKAEDKAADTKADANYKLAVEKCDALTGDAKTSCVNAAKAKYAKS